MWLWERARLVTVAMEKALHKGGSRKKLTWTLTETADHGGVLTCVSSHS